MLVEDLGWGLPFKDLAGSAIERCFDALHLLSAPPRQVGALGKVLSQQAVVVLVGGALPGAVWVGEVDRDPGLDLELGVLGEFLARSQVSVRVATARAGSSSSRREPPSSQPRRIRRAVVRSWSAQRSVALGAGQVHQHRVPRAPLDQGADRRAVQPDDQIPLPMPRHRTVLDLGGPLTDHYVGGDVSTWLVARPGRGTRGARPASLSWP